MIIHTNTIQMLSRQLEIILLHNLHQETRNSPWSSFNRLSFDEVLEVKDTKGYLVAKELIRRSDIRAYRYEEAINGDI